MRDYGRVYSSFWQSPEVRALGEDARTLALYLLTSPHGNLIGCFRLPDAYAADDLQWPCARVAEGFAELCAKGFVSRDEGTKWVFITKFLKWNAFESPNVAKSAHKAFDQVPALPLKAALALALLEFGAHLQEPLTKACEALAKPIANPEPEPEPTRTRTSSRTRAGTRTKPEPLSPGVADAPPVAPKTPSSETWNAYASAYADRYGATPVRNAKVNGQLAQFVARVGAEESPGVARFFVGHQGQFYVRSMHSTDLLLRDAEKLRTEWATNRQITNAGAVMADRTQTNLNAFGKLLADAEQREAIGAK